MASADERFQMPDGSVYIVRRPAAESGGAFVEMEFVLPSGCVPPPPHVHRHQVEQYEVLAGRFDLVVEGRWRTLEPGKSAEVAVGACTRSGIARASPSECATSTGPRCASRSSSSARATPCEQRES